MALAVSRLCVAAYLLCPLRAAGRRRNVPVRVFLISLPRIRTPLLVALVGAGLCLWTAAAPARALILAPATLDGPSSAIGEYGGGAVSSDGSGGVVYVKQVAGVPHVFASQFVDNHWLAPVRVDWQSQYAASFPRIAAADGGELVVVWVTPIATVAGRIQQALVSSVLDPGSNTFGEPYVVDPNVGEGEGVSPSLAIASNGQGLVAYRAVTNNFENSGITTSILPLRPGDVVADVRIAVFGGQRWSSPERINRDPLLSMRAPTEQNGPQVALGRGNQAVVAWQEPEPEGTARIWARRVFGTTLGLAMPASPLTYNGRPITEDAGPFALSVSALGEAKVVSRVPVAAGAPQLFLNTLENSTAVAAAHFTGALSVGQPHAGDPSVAVDDDGDFRLAFSAGGAAQLLLGTETGPLAPEVGLGPALASTGAGTVTTLDPAGGGVTAWPGADGLGVREDFPNGGAQAALVSGAVQGPVSQLSADGSESGEALVGFREGDPGDYEIVGDRATVPPPQFLVSAPFNWVRPSGARFSWSEAEDATGGVTYSVLVDGHVVSRGLRVMSALPDRRVLGSGVHKIQILATDAAGQQTLSAEGSLHIDGSPPVASVRHTRGRTVLVQIRDAQSGAVARYARISFGDGTTTTRKLKLSHTYAHAGRYTITVAMRDRLGNSGTAHLRVSVQ